MDLLLFLYKIFFKMSNCSQGIFGSPAEPLFNNEFHSVSSEMLQDWLVTSAKSNILDVKTSKETQHIFGTGGWCECVFLVCEKFDLPWQAKFAALDILDRFMLKHVQGLYKYVQNSESNNKKADWTKILERISKQAFLRIVTCCQVASKLNSHYKVIVLQVITVKRVRRCLLDAGYSYSCESILQSEMRVLKTLSYQVSKVTCVDFVEIILEILGRNSMDEAANIKVYHELAVKILTVVCIYQDEIYDRLYFTVARPEFGFLPSTEEQNRKLAAVKADKMLLAVSVIAAAVHIIDESHTSQVIAHLHAISEVPLEDIEDFVQVVLQHVQEDLGE
ncbi:cyclin N-terminal domain-containing protein 1 [Aplysia californica]|uniref:Cyclin N-terminal domain-containing protein 1 n=1 Tax=Aplysia californica TaxID=6500 RepID=A0ABM1W0Z4_APLCA|nr:cyclin N-terminal domain-containing protein 1 [Aplysia californica]